jgi:hypothetical protein
MPTVAAWVLIPCHLAPGCQPLGGTHHLCLRHLYPEGECEAFVTNYKIARRQKPEHHVLTSSPTSRTSSHSLTRLCASMAPRKKTCRRTPTCRGPVLFTGSAHLSYRQGCIISFSRSNPTLVFIRSGHALRRKGSDYITLRVYSCLFILHDIASVVYLARLLCVSCPECN